jgi:kynurenine formamidase
VLSPEFPTYSGEPGIAFETILEYERDRKNVKRWIVHEHVGTHFDAPIHFSVNALCSHEVSIDRLVVPLAVVDISHRAESNPDTELTPDDILKWEAEHGPLPSGGCLAMNSGWDRHAGSPKFRNADPANTLHFPGFHAEATELLLERDVAGVGVEFLSTAGCLYCRRRTPDQGRNGWSEPNVCARIAIHINSIVIEMYQTDAGAQRRWPLNPVRRV